jgi:F-box-like
MQELLTTPHNKLDTWNSVFFLLAGLGTLSSLEDELVLGILALLDARDLCVLAATSKSLYCFSNHEELWRSLVLEVCCAFLHNAASLPAVRSSMHRLAARR